VRGKVPARLLSHCHICYYKKAREGAERGRGRGRETERERERNL